MPQELLRDVLRTGDAKSRVRRRLSILPVSIAVHATAISAMLIIPLVADVTPPNPAGPTVWWVEIRRVSLPQIAPPGAQRAPQPTQAAIPLAAPDHIAPEVPRGAPIDGAFVGVMADATSGLDVGVGVSVPTDPPVVEPPPLPPAVVKPVRPGGLIREPKKIVHVPPLYPAIAQQAHVEGIVILEAVIDERGNVDHVKVLRSRPLLDQAAIDAVRAWKYTPTLLNGVPVQVLMTITVTFNLH
jgi:periplasmic protein TonB